jgi:DNA modification methylase
MMTPAPAHILIEADARRIPLADRSAHCVVTSPPYFALRDNGNARQIGLESTLAEYLAQLVAAFAEIWRTLRDDGTLWLNIGDTYNAYNGNAGPSTSFSRGRHDQARPALPRGHGLLAKSFKNKDRLGVPHRLVFALQEYGWRFRDEIVWSKPNPMPESVSDRCTKSHELLFMLAKSEHYHYDQDAIKERSKIPGQLKSFANVKKQARAYGRNCTKNGNESPDAPPVPTPEFRNLRSVWTIQPQPFPGAHFSTMPAQLAHRCILAGSPPGGIILDPFAGAGTTGLAALALGRSFIGLDLARPYLRIARRRITRPHAANPPLRPETDAELPLFRPRTE